MQQALFDLAKLVNNLYTFKEHKKSPFIIDKHAIASPKHDSYSSHTIMFVLFYLSVFCSKNDLQNILSNRHLSVWLLEYNMSILTYFVFSWFLLVMLYQNVYIMLESQKYWTARIKD